MKERELSINQESDSAGLPDVNINFKSGQGELLHDSDGSFVRANKVISN